MKLAIYGAQGMALAAVKAFTELYPQRAVTCFLVTELGNNASEVMGLPVMEAREYLAKYGAEARENAEILIATPESVQDEIEEYLVSLGFRHYRRLTSMQWAELMELYYARQGQFLPLRALPLGVNPPFVRAYAAQSDKDRALRGHYDIPEWIVPIQVGTALAERKTAAVQDHVGENISERNGNYCELTGLYWVWKHKLQTPDGGTDVNQYYGLAQYRRILELSNEDILRLADNDVDVVLPYPMPYEPDISVHHKRYLKDADWKALEQAIAEVQPAYVDALQQAMRQTYLYNYNVILAKKNVLRDYCAWLFSILQRTEELSVPKGSERSDRYLGYMGENLETVYFLHHAKDLNIVHAGCRFLV